MIAGESLMSNGRDSRWKEMKQIQDHPGSIRMEILQREDPVYAVLSTRD
jgi:hypothetical protein